MGVCSAFGKKITFVFNRIKSSFFSTRLSVLRFAVLVLTVGTLFLPLAHIGLSVPFCECDNNIGLFDLLGCLFSGFGFESFFGLLKGSSETGCAIIFFALFAIFDFALAAAALLGFPFTVVFGDNKGFKRRVALSVCGSVFALLCILCFAVFNSFISHRFGSVYSSRICLGGFLSAFLFLLNIILNIRIETDPVNQTVCPQEGADEGSVCAEDDTQMQSEHEKDKSSVTG